MESLDSFYKHYKLSSLIQNLWGRRDHLQPHEDTLRSWGRRFTRQRVMFSTQEASRYCYALGLHNESLCFLFFFHRKRKENNNLMTWMKMLPHPGSHIWIFGSQFLVLLLKRLGHMPCWKIWIPGGDTTLMVQNLMLVPPLTSIPMCNLRIRCGPWVPITSTACIFSHCLWEMKVIRQKLDWESWRKNAGPHSISHTIPLVLLTLFSGKVLVAGICISNVLPFHLQSLHWSPLPKFSKQKLSLFRFPPISFHGKVQVSYLGIPFLVSLYVLFKTLWV